MQGHEPVERRSLTRNPQLTGKVIDQLGGGGEQDLKIEQCNQYKRVTDEILRL